MKISFIAVTLGFVFSLATEQEDSNTLFGLSRCNPSFNPATDYKDLCPGINNESKECSEFKKLTFNIGNFTLEQKFATTFENIPDYNKIAKILFCFLNMPNTSNTLYSGLKTYKSYKFQFFDYQTINDHLDPGYFLNSDYPKFVDFLKNIQGSYGFHIGFIKSKEIYIFVAKTKE